MDNLYTTYTLEEIKLFQKLSTKKENITATSKILSLSKKISIFKEIPENVLVKILKDIKIVKYNKNEIIIKEGDSDTTIFYILLGSVKVIKQNQIITKLSRNSIIGEMAGLLNQKRTASIKANEDNTTIISFKIDFDLIQTNLGYYFALIYKNLSTELAKKIVYQNNQIINK